MSFYHHLTPPITTSSHNKTLNACLLVRVLTGGGGGGVALKKILCPDSYYYLGIKIFKITIFFGTNIFFQIHNSFFGGGGGGVHYKFLVLFLYLLGLIETLFFSWGNLKKNNTLCFAYFKPK